MTIDNLINWLEEAEDNNTWLVSTQSVKRHLEKIKETEQLTLTDVGCRKLNEWIKIDPTKANTIPEEPVWIMTIDRKEIEYKEADEYIELNYASHYRLIDEPEPPL